MRLQDKGFPGAVVHTGSYFFPQLTHAAPKQAACRSPFPCPWLFALSASNAPMCYLDECRRRVGSGGVVL